MTDSETVVRMSGLTDPSRTAELRSRYYALAAAVAQVAADFAAVEEGTAAVLLRRAALRPDRAAQLTALAAQAHRCAEQGRTAHARWHGVATQAGYRRSKYPA